MSPKGYREEFFRKTELHVLLFREQRRWLEIRNTKIFQRKIEMDLQFRKKLTRIESLLIPILHVLWNSDCNKLLCNMRYWNVLYYYLAVKPMSLFMDGCTHQGQSHKFSHQIAYRNRDPEPEPVDPLFFLNS